MATITTTLFADRVAEAVVRKRTQLVVGLDPRPELLPVELRGEPEIERLGGALPRERRPVGIRVIARGLRVDHAGWLFQ